MDGSARVFVVNMLKIKKHFPKYSFQIVERDFPNNKYS